MLIRHQIQEQIDYYRSLNLKVVRVNLSKDGEKLLQEEIGEFVLGRLPDSISEKDRQVFLNIDGALIDGIPYSVVDELESSEDVFDPNTASVSLSLFEIVVSRQDIGIQKEDLKFKVEIPFDDDYTRIHPMCKVTVSDKEIPLLNNFSLQHLEGTVKISKIGVKDREFGVKEKYIGEITIPVESNFRNFTEKELKELFDFNPSLRFDPVMGEMKLTCVGITPKFPN